MPWAHRNEMNDLILRVAIWMNLTNNMLTRQKEATYCQLQKQGGNGAIVLIVRILITLGEVNRERV